MQFNKMKFRAVAFVLAEAILGKTSAEVAHNRVARDFRDHARGGDAQTVAVAVNDRRLWQWKRKNGEAVDENVLRLEGKRCERGAHGLVGGAQDIDRVDLHRIDDSDGPDDRAIGDEIVINFFAFLREQLLGVVETPVPKFFRQNNRGGYDRARECAAPSFIDAGDGRDAEAAQFAFVPETTASIHRGKILKR
jgi:hypothetical protein